ncbi:MAG TPA: SCE4755 family polysaccharide monooxygenase-like protein [Polyangia bacterium]
MRTLVVLVALFPCLVSARLAEAHIRLTSPTARYVQDDNGLKIGPCGSGTATGTVTPIVPGQTLTVTWKESVSHAGHYRIALSANASDFTEPTNLTIPATLPSWDLADGIQDKTGTQTYSQAVQIPNTECPACVLQLLQIMSAGTDGTNSGTFSGVYHACADVAISASNADAGAGRDGAAAVDLRLDTGLRDSADGNGVHMDTAQAAGGAAGTGGSGSGVTGAGGSMSGAGGATGAGESGTGEGGGVGAGGSTSKSAGGNGGTAGANGGTFGGATAGHGGSAGGSGGSIVSSGGSAGGSAGQASSAGGSSGSGNAASGGSAGNSASSGGRGGTSETSPASSPGGCGCQLGSHSTPSVVTLLSLLACCLVLVRRSRQSESRLTGTDRPPPTNRGGPGGQCLRK